MISTLSTLLERLKKQSDRFEHIWGPSHEAKSCFLSFILLFNLLDQGRI
jgi:hypothetical protein